MQKDQFNKGEQKIESKESNKLKQVGHNINAGLKENVGVGVGNYSSTEDRQQSAKNEQLYNEKKRDEQWKRDWNKGSTTNPKGTTEETGKFTHKAKQVGHDINAGLKENVGVGVGNYSSTEDRQQSAKHEQKYDEKKRDEERRDDRETDFSDKKETTEENTGLVGHKVQEIGHSINATLKENIGVGVGDYSSEVDREKAQEHQKQYEKLLEQRKEEFEEKKEEMKEKLGPKGETGVYGHKFQEIGHSINANLKESIGVGVGDYSSEVDREKAQEHREGYEEKVKEESKPEVGESSSLVHKVKEVAHVVNANLKEMVGLGFGNYSSEVDREIAQEHKEKYEEKVQQQQESLSKDDNNDNNDNRTCNDTFKEKEFSSINRDTCKTTDPSCTKDSNFSSTNRDTCKTNDPSCTKDSNFSSTNRDTTFKTTDPSFTNNSNLSSTNRDTTFKTTDPSFTTNSNLSSTNRDTTFNTTDPSFTTNNNLSSTNRDTTFNTTDPSFTTNSNLSSTNRDTTFNTTDPSFTTNSNFSSTNKDSWKTTGSNENKL